MLLCIGVVELPILQLLNPSSVNQQSHNPILLIKMMFIVLGVLAHFAFGFNVSLIIETLLDPKAQFEAIAKELTNGSLVPRYLKNVARRPSKS
jgi:hypothetical protein